MRHNKTPKGKSDAPTLNRQTIDKIINRAAPLKGGLMVALHGLQNAFGAIPEESYPLLAAAFNLSRAEVYGVKSFYHDFRSVPSGNHIIKICQAESCQARGSRNLTKHVQDSLGITLGQTTPDGHITLEAVYCLGNCAVSPNVMVDDRVYGRVDAARFDDILKKEEAVL